MMMQSIYYTFLAVSTYGYVALLGMSGIKSDMNPGREGARRDFAFI